MHKIECACGHTHHGVCYEQGCNCPYPITEEGEAKLDHRDLQQRKFKGMGAALRNDNPRPGRCIVCGKRDGRHQLWCAAPWRGDWT